MSRGGFGQKIVRREFGQSQLAQFPPDEPVASGRLKPGDTMGQFFVQGIVFFVGQVGIRHRFLLVPKLLKHFGPHTHRVKDLYRIFTDGIIEHFNRITRPVEANEAVFVVVTFQFPRKNSRSVSMANIFFGNMVFERGRNEDKFRLHILILPQNRGGGKNVKWGEKEWGVGREE
jgi:hypothetical protein